MALSRRFLSALGIEQEKIDEIINAHVETVDALKAERDGYKKDVENHTASLAELQKELEELKKSGSKDDVLKKKYDDLKEEYDKFKAEQKEEKTAREKAEKYKELLRDAGISEKRILAILKVTDLKSIEFDENGNIKDVEAVKENVKKEWSDFIESEKTSGANTSTPPANAGTKGMTRKEIMAIRDSEARQRAIAENHELFGF